MIYRPFKFVIFTFLIILFNIQIVLISNCYAQNTEDKRAPLISIIVPIYNTAQYLDECIQSILKQNFKNIELILINDGSPDNAREVCRPYLKDSRVRYFEQKNQGVSVARNLGIDKAIGEYIYFVDSDDYLVGDSYLKTCYDKITEKDYDILIIGERNLKKTIELTSAIITWGFMFKRDILIKNPDIRFTPNIQPGEDGIFSHELLTITKKEKVAFIKDIAFFYREWKGSNTAAVIKDCQKVLSKLPIWFTALDSFYEKRNLYPHKSLNLALFLEQELFERFSWMPLTLEQQKTLFYRIKDFYNAHIAPYITQEERKKLSPFFLILTNSDYYYTFKIKKWILILKHVAILSKRAIFN